MLGEDPLRSRLPYWGFRTDAIVPGDVRASLAGLATRLDKHSPKETSRWRANRKKERDSLRAAARAAGGEAPITTAWVAHELNELLPRDAVLVNETITHRARSPEPGRSARPRGASTRRASAGSASASVSRWV